MNFVQAGKKGISVKLNPSEQDRIFTGRTDDGQELRIVKGVIVRVDAPSAQMGDALHQEVYPARNQDGDIVAGARGHTLLVETDEDPTPPTPAPGRELQQQLDQLPTAGMTPEAEKAARLSVLQREAAAMGLTITDNNAATDEAVIRPTNPDGSPVVTNDSGSGDNGKTAKTK